MNLLRPTLIAVVLVAATGCPKRVDRGSDGPPRSYPLLAATAEKETSQLTQKREDVEIDTRDFERVPRVVATGETPLIRLDGARARLFGDPKGTEGWMVDNFVLLEVVDPRGRITNRAVAGFTEGVLVGSERIDSIGPLTFRFQPGEIDITRLLPEGSPFKLRATALDYSGVGRVSDLYLMLDHGGPGTSDDDLRGQ